MTTDLTQTIAPKSDQLNFDDFIGGRTMIIKITKVSMVTGDQPIAINYEGDNGKPYKPSKGMRRVLIAIWGGDGAQYVGRHLKLYGDPTVKFGKDQVGGIRIGEMSHMQNEQTLMLTTSKAVRKPYVVKPLQVQQNSQSAQQKPADAQHQTKKPDAQAPNLGQPVTETPFPVVLRDKTVYAADPKAWVLLFNSFLVKCETAAQIETFVGRNTDVFAKLRELGHGAEVDEIDSDIAAAEKALAPATDNSP